MSEKEAPQPLGCASVTAVAVPIVGAAIYFSVADSFGVSVETFLIVAYFGVLIGAPHLFALFLPAWLLLSRRQDMSGGGAAVLGLVCGGLPALLLTGGARQPAEFFGLCGLAGGLSFWATLKLRSRRPPAA